MPPSVVSASWRRAPEPLAALGYTSAPVQRLRRLLGRRSERQEERAFVAEGAKVIGEALGAGSGVEALFVDAAAAGAAELAVLDQARSGGCPVHELAAGVLGRVARTVTPQPLLAVVALVDRPLDQLARTGVVVVCAEVRDPGNLGTVLRSAEAAGVSGVLCPDGTVDPYNPKCVRASAGALFHVPLVVGGNTVQVLGQLATWGFQRLGASARAGSTLWSTDLTGPLALVLGNEAAGLAPAIAAEVDGLVSIPIEGRAESLNVGMAATVLVYEAARQRRAAAEGERTAPSAGLRGERVGSPCDARRATP